MTKLVSGRETAVQIVGDFSMSMGRGKRKAEGGGDRRWIDESKGSQRNVEGMSKDEKAVCGRKGGIFGVFGAEVEQYRMGIG
jgi:hypothetical protein